MKEKQSSIENEMRKFCLIFFATVQFSLVFSQALYGGDLSSEMGSDMESDMESDIGLESLMLNCPDEDFFDDLDIDLESDPIVTNPFQLELGHSIAYGLDQPINGFARSDSGLNKSLSFLRFRISDQVFESCNGVLEIYGAHESRYVLNGDLKASDKEKSEYQNQGEWKDAYLNCQLTNTTAMSIGHQVHVLGLSEYFAIADRVAPLDWRDLGVLDIEDQRRNVKSIQLLHESDNLTLETIYTYDARKNRVAPIGNEFSLYEGLALVGLKLDQQQVDNDGELFARVGYRFDGGDVHLVVGDENQNTTSIQGLDLTTGSVKLSQGRSQFAAVYGQYAVSDYVLKTEFGYHRDLYEIPTNGQFPIVNGWPLTNQIRSAFIADYTGMESTTLTLELHYKDIEEDSLKPFNSNSQYGYATRWYQQFWNETLDLQIDVIKSIGESSVLGKIMMNYRLSDQFKVGSSYITYNSNSFNDSLYKFKQNDMLQLSITYHL